MNGIKDGGSDDTSFNWSPEYDELLEKIATSDYVEHDWGHLCKIIMHKLDQNTASYLSDPPPRSPSPPTQSTTGDESSKANESLSSITTEGTTTTTGSPKANQPALTGAKFPPFSREKVPEITRKEYNSHGPPRTVLTEEEASKSKAEIRKVLQEFEGQPPFTIQRLCELLVKPRSYYTTLGKYLRAVERTVLVTSTIDAFPIVPPEEQASSLAAGPSFASPVGSLRESSTPLFSPIPFLHEDARSRSKSPPMSPLMLATGRPQSPESIHLTGAPGSNAGMSSDAATGPAGPALGLVDELDDPKPGHMSDKPHALTSTTSTSSDLSQSDSSTTAEKPSTMAVAGSKPMFGGSLTDRFVKGTEEKERGQKTEGSAGSDDQGENMAVDDGEADKENVPK